MKETSSPRAESIAPAAIPALDLAAQYQTIGGDLESAVLRVLRSQHFILGPEVDALERELAAYIGCRHVIGVASGSDAILLALTALGVGPGDEVVTSPYTFFATVGSIVRLGATPVLVDIDPASYNIDPTALEDYLAGRHPLLNDRSRFDHDPRRVKAVMPVHLYGQCADMDSIAESCDSRGITVVEDAAQAIGSRYQGRSAGTMSRIGCFSFYPSKNLGGAGDGGAISTGDDVLAEKLRVLRVHGAKPKYFHSVVGFNSRLDALQAAVLRVKLPHLDGWSDGRGRAADRYDALLAGTGVAAPWRRPGDRHVFNQYVVLLQERDARMRKLKQAGIGCEIYYPRPLHLQECFASLGYRQGDLPHSERAAAQSLALPMFPELTAAQQERVAAVLTDQAGA